MAEVNEQYFPTGNISRDSVILTAIAEASPNASLEEVAEQIPQAIRASFGALLPEELSEARQWLAAAAQAQHGDVQVEPVEPVESPISREEILSTIAALTQGIGQERGELARLQSVHANARGALSDSIMRWQQRHGAVTFEQLIRAEIRANQQLKQDVKDGKIEPRRSGRVLRSAVDAMAAATAEAGQRAGGGLAFRRGATTLRGRRVR